MTDRRRLFCRSGGGFPGLDIHVGIWRALQDAGIVADANAGTSAGAVIAAFDSAGYRADTAGAIVHKLRDRDVREERLFWKLRVPWIDSFLSRRPIVDILDDLLPLSFSDLKKPLSIFTTDETNARSCVFEDGDLIMALAASLAIAGVFPPVVVHGRKPGTDRVYSDGGTTSYLPLPERWEQYDEIWLLIARRPIEYTGTGLVGRLLWNVDLTCEDQVRDTIVFAQARHPCVRVIRPACRVGSSLHFNHDLIDGAYSYTQSWLYEQNLCGRGTH